MNFKPVFHVIARLMGVVGLLMGLCGAVSYLFGEPVSAWGALAQSGGARERLQAALADVDQDTHLHVSFDMDCLDPSVAPGVGTGVRGGPTYRETQLCMEMLADCGALGSADLVELNPALDVRNKTAVLAVDLVESLFGKSTLMRTRPF